MLNPVQELISGAPIANPLTELGLDEYFTRIEASGTSNYLRDALGSTMALANGSGTVVAEYTYEPFGGTIASGALSGNTLGFTVREADGTGLYYYRARYYDSRLQRFASEDPIGFEGGDPNMHAYVANAPTMGTDPLGLEVVIFTRQLPTPPRDHQGPATIQGSISA